jgi:hypothetical protein
MKNILFILICIIGFSSIRSQNKILAGNTLSYYSDINPDTLINYVSNYPYNSSESYFIDMNGDLVNDLKIYAYWGATMVMASMGITITALNSSSMILFGRREAVYNTYMQYWMVDSVAKPLILGDTINTDSAVWSSKLFLTGSYSMTGSGISVTDFVGSSDLYVGIKFTASDTVFGWIRVNCPSSNKCYLKDFSASSELTTIKKSVANDFFIFPNPASNKIQIASSTQKIKEIGITDLNGIKIKSFPFMKIEKEIDVSDLEAGIYFLSIFTDNGLLTKKIIIER